MPAKDHYHDAVKRALIKDGWNIIEEQVKLNCGVRRLWIDLLAGKADQNLVVLIEVKGFENSPSAVEELANAVGQYIIYQAALAVKNQVIPLFLAVPNTAFFGILSEVLGQQVRAQIGMRLLVFDPVEEEIIEWLPSLTK